MGSMVPLSSHRKTYITWTPLGYSNYVVDRASASKHHEWPKLKSRYIGRIPSRVGKFWCCFKNAWMTGGHLSFPMENRNSTYIVHLGYHTVKDFPPKHPSLPFIPHRWLNACFFHKRRPFIIPSWEWLWRGKLVLSFISFLSHEPISSEVRRRSNESSTTQQVCSSGAHNLVVAGEVICVLTCCSLKMAILAAPKNCCKYITLIQVFALSIVPRILLLQYRNMQNEPEENTRAQTQSMIFTMHYTEHQPRRRMDSNKHPQLVPPYFYEPTQRGATLARVFHLLIY